MKHAFAIMDYDNARLKPERTPFDVEQNLSIVVPRIVSAIKGLLPEVEEITFRLYGGWTTLDRQTTRQAAWLVAETARLRRRLDGVRLKFLVVQEIIARPDMTLIGTYRDGSQKMVDGMIAADIVELAVDTNISLVLISDDDDFIPCLLASSSKRRRQDPIRVLRKLKAPSSGSNDSHLIACNVDMSIF